MDVPPLSAIILNESDRRKRTVALTELEHIRWGTTLRVESMEPGANGCFRRMKSTGTSEALTRERLLHIAHPGAILGRKQLFECLGRPL